MSIAMVLHFATFSWHNDFDIIQIWSVRVYDAWDEENSISPRLCDSFICLCSPFHFEVKDELSLNAF